MKHISLSRARLKFGCLIGAVARAGKPVLITKYGSPAAVIMSASEFYGWKETAAIRSDVALMRDIRNGLRERKAGKARLYTVDELFREK